MSRETHDPNRRQAPRHPFVVIEGVDGTGKSTVAELLANALRGIYFRTPSGPYATLRRFVDKGFDPAIRFRFYLEAVAHASSEIRALIDHRPVVCDRYLRSTLVYHRALGACVDLEPELEDALIMPDFEFVLTASSGVRNERLARRDDRDASDRHIEMNSTFLDRAQEGFLAGEIVALDTSRTAPRELVKMMLGQNRQPACANGRALP